MGRLIHTDREYRGEYDFYYNEAGLLAKTYDIEREETQLYSYDLSGRLVGTSYLDDQQHGAKFAYKYDDLNRVYAQSSRILLPNYTKSSIMFYNRVYGRLENQQLLKGNEYILPTIYYSYDNAGRPNEKEWGNVNTTTYYKDGVGYRSEILDRYQVSYGIYDNYEYKYLYDQDGNITEIQNNGSRHDGKVKYTYDLLGQLKKAEYYNEYNSQVGSETFNYDSDGNITSRTYTKGNTTDTYTYTYDNKGIMLTGVKKNNQDVRTFYTADRPWPDSDTNKNVVWSGSLLATYNMSNFAYSADGTKRVYKQDSMYDSSGWNYFQHHYYYYEGDKLTYEYIESTEFGDKLLEYIYDADGVSFILLTRNPGQQNEALEKYYLVKNGQGDVTNVMRINGEGADHPLTTVATYTYSAYGEIIDILDENGQQINTDTTTYPYEDRESLSAMMNSIAVLNPFRYRSYYYDNVNKMYNCNTRYYDPMLCRFLSPDCYVNQDQGIIGMNIYAYCNNNPVNFIDPNGTFFGEIFNWFKKAASAAVKVVKSLFGAKAKVSTQLKDEKVTNFVVGKYKTGEKEVVSSTPESKPIEFYTESNITTGASQAGVQVSAGGVALGASASFTGISETASFSAGHGASVSLTGTESLLCYSITYAASATIGNVTTVEYTTIEINKAALAIAVLVGVFAPQIVMPAATVATKIMVFA